MTAAAAVALALLSAAAGALLARRRSPRREPDPNDSLRRIAAEAPVGFWTIDRDGVITMATGQGLARVLGPPERLVGLTATAVLADHPRIAERIREALEGRPASALAELNGRLMEAHLFPITEDDGTVSGLRGVAIDVTERYESEELLHLLADSIAEVIWMASPGLEGFHYVSLGLRDIWGRSREWLTDGGDWFEAVHPDDRERVRQIVAAAVKSPVECLHRIVRPDGGVRWVRTRLFPIRRGSALSLAGIAEDRTPHHSAERELDRVRARLSDAQRIARLGNWDWDIANDRLWWSEQVPGIVGFEARVAPASLDQALARVHPDDHDRVAAALERARSDGEPFSMVHRVVHESGETRIVQQKGEVSLDEAGRPIRLIGTIQDVTEAHQAGQQLAILSRAVEQSDDDVLIMDADWRISYANPAFERHTGWSLDEVAGRTPEEVLSAENLSEPMRQNLAAALAEGQTFRGIFLNRRRDGTRYHDEKTITPIRDAGGRITHYLSSGRDVTEQRQRDLMERSLQEALRRSAEEWRQTFDAVDTAVVVVGADLTVTRLNSAARELIGRPFSALVGARLPQKGGEPLETVVRVAAAVSASGEASSSRAEGADGRVWEVVASTALRGVPPPVGAIVLLSDVTEREQLQASLRRSERMSAMGALVAGVAHEVRNPLFAISATLDAFESEFAGNEEYREYSQLLQTEVDRLSHLMRDLLEYGRPSAAELSPQSIGDTLARGLAACQRQAEAAGVALESDLAVDPTPMQVDAPRLEQVVQNLVQNAVEHSPRGGRVRLVARETDGGVECRIEDEGPGFAEGDLERVLDPFFTRRRSGTGLGLSIVQRIVQDHGGEVVPANRSGEPGAVVTIRLPRPRKKVP